MASEDPQRIYQASVESAASSPFPPSPSSPRRSSYWDQQHEQPHPSAAPAGRPAKTPDQPIEDAVNSAFDKSDTTSQFSPELVHRITQAVIENMRMAGISPTASASGSSQSLPHSTKGQAPPRNVYTPPSPENPPVNGNMHDIRVDQLDGPRKEAPNPQPYGPKMSLEREYPTVLEPSSPEDTSTLEKIWQPLFDADSYPTARLGQFLRGIALHITEEFEPCNGLVITPAKMRKFYEEVRLQEEVFPWTAVFSGALSNSSLSHIYRDLYCEHHFVQKEPIDKPSIPALTPSGFQVWMTHLIRAYPDEEAKRFAKVLQKYAVSNADDRKERFPKQLPRCLFPAASHRSSRHDMEDIVLAHPDLKGFNRARGQSDAQPMSQQPPPPPPPSSSQPQVYTPPPPPRYAKSPNRENRSYPTSVDGATDDGSSVAQPFERERKPYSAAPGAGKSYEDAPGSSNIRRTQSNTGSRPNLDEDGARSRHRRSGSNASHAGHMAPRVGGRSPSARRDEGMEDLARHASRDSRDVHSDRRSRHGPPGLNPEYEDERRRSGTGPPPYSHGQYAPPPQPRY